MKSIRIYLSLSIVLSTVILFSCNSEPAPSETKKYLFHPPAPEIVLIGSVMELNGGILVLVQNGPLEKIPIILIPSNDSSRTVMKKAYQIRTESQYQASLAPWVKITGNFIREDSLSPIFKYNYVVLLDKTEEQQEVEEMEE